MVREGSPDLTELPSLIPFCLSLAISSRCQDCKLYRRKAQLAGGFLSIGTIWSYRSTSYSSTIFWSRSLSPAKTTLHSKCVCGAHGSSPGPYPLVVRESKFPPQGIKNNSPCWASGGFTSQWQFLFESLSKGSDPVAAAKLPGVPGRARFEANRYIN